MRITYGSCSRGRLVVKRAMNSQYRSAVSITARLIVPAMSGPGGRPQASIRSRLRANFGRTRVQKKVSKGRRQFRHWWRDARVYLLDVRAQFDASARTVHIRLAAHDGRTYLDLADKDWRAVQIGPDGWQVVTSPPVRFRRAAGMLPLPIPQRGGSIEALAAFLNLPAPDEFVLVVAWLLAAPH